MKKNDEKKIDKILKNEYVPEYVPVDNIILQIDELVNNIMEKKQVVLELKKENNEFNQNINNINIIVGDINLDLIKIVELQKNQLLIDFSKMDNNEKFASIVRLLKIGIVIKELHDVVPNCILNSEILEELSKYGI